MKHRCNGSISLKKLSINHTLKQPNNKPTLILLIFMSKFNNNLYIQLETIFNIIIIYNNIDKLDINQLENRIN